MWRLIFFISLGYNLSKLSNCGADLSPIVPLIYPPVENLILKPNSENDLLKNSPIPMTTGLESRGQGHAVVKAAFNVVSSQNIEEMTKRFETFSRKFSADLLKEKPFATKFKANFDKIVAKAKPILEAAKKLEKAGKKRSKKDLAAFQANMKNFENQILSFTKSVNAESQKQRSRNIKLMKNHPSDVSVLGDAKRFINIVDVLTDTIRLLQSIPGKINCFIFGYCEVDNSEDDCDDEKPDNSIDDEPEEDEDEPEEDEDEPDGDDEDEEEEE